ncbi:SepM family pheromone-processing serine protease [Robertmurraya sp.]|jgi:Lon-like protease|uniref:SepM family pheromone-processing serine protease n=1 Tax=Robertmurraya sp. TaxID=2837525 RepID=UPI003703B65B
MNKKWIGRIVLYIIAIALLVGAFFSLPYYITKPGMAKELDPIIEVEGGYEEEGSFMLTTVVMGQANIYTYLLAKISEYQEIYPLSAIRAEEESDEEYKVRQLHSMSTSKLAAIEVAYKKANKPISFEYKGVYVLSVMDGMPAMGQLEPGDRIFQVDELTFQSSEEFINYVSKKQAGDTITLYFERNEKEENVTLPLKAFEADQTKVGVGIGLVDDKEIIVEPEVTVETSDIGGPSAGLMFSLEIYNQLVKEDLTKGYNIAGTGTIDENGTVGRIGGIEQKVIAADKADAEIFFAPNEEGAADSNYLAAVQTAKDIDTSMKIVPINTFEDAITYLEVLEKKEE